MLRELAPEEEVIRGLSCEAVTVLDEDHRDTAGGHKVAHPVHARPLKARPALPGVLYLLQSFGPA